MSSWKSINLSLFTGRLLPYIYIYIILQCQNIPRFIVLFSLIAIIKGTSLFLVHSYSPKILFYFPADCMCLFIIARPLYVVLSFRKLLNGIVIVYFFPAECLSKRDLWYKLTTKILKFCVQYWRGCQSLLFQVTPQLLFSVGMWK